MEVVAQCKVYQINMICDKCGKGMMHVVGIATPLINEPNASPRFTHMCPECHATAIFDRKYPFMSLEAIEEPHPIEKSDSTSPVTSV